MKPSVGRIVHYVPSNGDRNHYAAIVCSVDPGNALNLSAFGTTGVQCSQQGVAEDQRGIALHSWHWPERDDTDL